MPENTEPLQPFRAHDWITADGRGRQIAHYHPRQHGDQRQHVPPPLRVSQPAPPPKPKPEPTPKPVQRAALTFADRIAALMRAGLSYSQAVEQLESQEVAS